MTRIRISADAEPGFSSWNFYTMDNEGAVVWAVVDLRRDPEWIHDHLSK